MQFSQNKITSGHPCKEADVSTNHGNYSWKSPVSISTIKKIKFNLIDKGRRIRSRILKDTVISFFPKHSNRGKPNKF